MARCVIVRAATGDALTHSLDLVIRLNLPSTSESSIQVEPEHTHHFPLSLQAGAVEHTHNYCYVCLLVKILIYVAICT